jgi:hypothetical protein
MGVCQSSLLSELGELYKSSGCSRAQINERRRE